MKKGHRSGLIKLLLFCQTAAVKHQHACQQRPLRKNVGTLSDPVHVAGIIKSGTQITHPQHEDEG